MLAHMELQHPRHNHSFNFSIRIFGSVNNIPCIMGCLNLSYGYSYLVGSEWLNLHR